MESNRTLLLLRGHSKMDDCLAMWERSRQAGYGVNFEDLIPGVAAVAVGVAADGEAPFASLTLAGPPAQLPVERAPSLAALLRKEAVRFAALAATVHPGLYVRVSPCGPEDGDGRADAGDEH
jgi:DNA-binding IclR family transcriptional regulator